MPAVQPERLQREVRIAFADLDQPEVFRRRLTHMYEFYADRTRRPSAATRARHATRAYGVPGPVQRAVARRLRVAVSEDQAGLAQALVPVLWRSEYREFRLLVAELLAGRSDPGAADLAEELALSAGDREVVEALAVTGLQGWRRAAPQALKDRCRLWVRAPDQKVRIWGLTVLASAIRDPDYAVDPDTLGLLHGLLVELSGRALRAYEELIRALVERNAPEAARFLSAELGRSTDRELAVAARLVQAIPEPHRAELDQILLGPK